MATREASAMTRPTDAPNGQGLAVQVEGLIKLFVDEGRGVELGPQDFALQEKKRALADAAIGECGGAAGGITRDDLLALLS